MTTTVWSASASLSLNTIVAPTESNRVAGLFFKVTVAGTTGSSEPNWPTTINQTVYDNNVRYVSFSAVFSDLQPINPSAIIELFTLQLVPALHDSSTIYRFHAGSNLNANGEIIWAGNAYQRLPVEATGFAYERGKIPRPKLIVSNATSFVSAILLAVNKITAGNDLTGAKFTRIRTFAKFIDAANFAGGTNPLGTPDSTVEFRRQIYTIDRKASENRDVVEFELAGSLDMAGIRAPKRQCTRSIFPSIGTFLQ